MRTRIEVLWVLFASSLFFVTACSGGGASTRGGGGQQKTSGDRTRVSQSEGVEPMWIQECPVHTKQLMTFCGEAHNTASYKAAYAASYADALGKLRRFIGQKVDARIEPDGQGGYSFQIQGVDDQAVTIRGAWEGERWAEVYDGPSGRTHDCYVMLTYPKLEYDKLMYKAVEVAQQRMSKAIALHAQGKGFSDQGRHAEAKVAFERAQALLRQLKEPQVIDGVSSNVLLEQIVADLRQSASKARESQNTALVVVGLTQDGTLQSQGRDLTNVRNSIQKWVASSGIKIRPGGLSTADVKAILSGDREASAQAAASKQAGLLLVVDLQCDFKTEEDGAYYSYAEGGLRLIRTSDGRELYTADLPRAKGAHVSRKGANTRALNTLLKKNVKSAVQTAVAKIPKG